MIISDIDNNNINNVMDRKRIISIEIPIFQVLMFSENALHVLFVPIFGIFSADTISISALNKSHSIYCNKCTVCRR